MQETSGGRGHASLCRAGPGDRSASAITTNAGSRLQRRASHMLINTFPKYQNHTIIGMRMTANVACFGERQSGLKPPNNSIRNTLVHLGFAYWATPNGTRACVLWDGKAYTGQSLRLVTRQADVACACTVRNRDRPLRCSDRSAACAAQEGLSWTITRGRAGQARKTSRSSLGKFVMGLCAPKLSQLLGALDSHHSTSHIPNTVSNYSSVPFERDRRGWRPDLCGFRCKLRLVKRLRGLGMAVLSSPRGKMRAAAPACTIVRERQCRPWCLGGACAEMLRSRDSVRSPSSTSAQPFSPWLGARGMVLLVTPASP